MRPLRDTLTLLSRSAPMRRVLRQLVAGERVDDVVRAAAGLAAHGFPVGIDLLAAPARTEAEAFAAVAAYRTLLDRLADAGLAAGTDVAVRPEVLGEPLLDGARKVCRTAARVGATVTVEQPASGDVDATLALVAALRAEFPDVGVALRAGEPRTEDDCRALSATGSRVRLERGGATDVAEVDKSYVRCLKVLLAGDGYPMIATHDPRLVEIAAALASRYGRAPSTYEIQMRDGIRVPEQRRLAASGEQVRVRLAYGAAWHGYLVGRVAERPADLRLFLTSLVSRR